MGENRGSFGSGTRRHAPGSFPGNAERIPTGIATLGVAFFLSVPIQWIAFGGVRSLLSLDAAHLVSFLTGCVPALGIAYGGYRLERGELPPERYPRIAGWCVGGLVLFLSLNLLLITVFPADTLAANVGWANGTAIYGAVGGLSIGIVEARAIERARAAERARVKAERAEAEREWFDYLNAILRHEVLNTANVIEGQTVLLAEEYGEDELGERLAAIRRQSREMTRVIDDVRVLIRATEEADEFRSVSLADVIATEVRSLEDTYEEIEIETSVPEEVAVLADDLLPRVFSNLLHNAVEHNDAEVARIQVSVDVTDGKVVIDVADNGPGIPPEKRPSLFERTRSNGSNHGLGLYLVRTVVERYGGTIELAETGEEGSTFRVELPRAPEPAGVGEPHDAKDVLAADGG